MARPLRLEYDAIFTILRADPIIIQRKHRGQTLSYKLTHYRKIKEA